MPSQNPHDMKFNSSCKTPRGISEMLADDSSCCHLGELLPHSAYINTSTANDTRTRMHPSPLLNLVCMFVHQTKPSRIRTAVYHHKDSVTVFIPAPEAEVKALVGLPVCFFNSLIVCFVPIILAAELKDLSFTSYTVSAVALVQPAGLHLTFFFFLFLPFSAWPCRRPSVNAQP